MAGKGRSRGDFLPLDVEGRHAGFDGGGVFGPLAVEAGEGDGVDLVVGEEHILAGAQLGGTLFECASELHAVDAAGDHAGWGFDDFVQGDLGGEDFLLLCAVEFGSGAAGVLGDAEAGLEFSGGVLIDCRRLCRQHRAATAAAGGPAFGELDGDAAAGGGIIEVGGVRVRCREER